MKARCAGRRAKRSTSYGARAGWPGPGSRGRRRRHTATHVVVACGSEAVIPPIPGLRDLDGIWTNREATALRTIPRRPARAWRRPCRRRVGPGYPPSRRRSGGRRGGGPPPVQGAGPSGRSAERCPSPRRRRSGRSDVGHFRPPRRRGLRPRLRGGQELRGDQLLVATGRRPRVDDIGLETVGLKPTARHPRRLRPSGRRTPMGHRRREWGGAPDSRRRVPGDTVTANILGQRVQPTTRRTPGWLDGPTGGFRGASTPPFQWYGPVVREIENGDATRAATPSPTVS